MKISLYFIAHRCSELSKKPSGEQRLKKYPEQVQLTQKSYLDNVANCFKLLSKLLFEFELSTLVLDTIPTMFACFRVLEKI